MPSDFIELIGEAAVRPLPAQTVEAVAKRLDDRLRLRFSRELGESIGQLLSLSISNV
jgi:hypothetical protein